MSVLRAAFCTPSRVRGVYRYLLKMIDQRENRKKLEKIMSPDPLIQGGNRDMIRQTINECIKMGLLKEDNDIIAINEVLPRESRKPDTGDVLLPITLANLLFDKENNENEDFGKVTSWYMSQDIYNAPGNWKSAEDILLHKNPIDGKLGLNSTRFDQFEDWACFMGLAWRYSVKGEKKLIPDPTRYLRECLGEIFEREQGKSLTVSQTLGSLSDKCPVFEGGRLRGEIEVLIGGRKEKHLSTVTAFALLRLHDDKTIQLIQESDADVVIFPSVHNNYRFSKIVWHGQQ